MSALGMLEQSVATFALHAFWQVPLLACSAWAAVRLGRPQARTAHGVWVATLIVCVVLPVCSTIAARRAAVAAERRERVFVSYDPAASQGEMRPMQRQPAWKRMLRRHLNVQDGLQPFAVTIPREWFFVIACGWLFAAAFSCAQLILGWIRVRSLIRGASDEPLPHAIAAALQAQCEQLGLAIPAARLHDSIAGPVLAGVARPTLLLPADSASEMSGAEMQAVLAHELAHLRRHDPVVHAACSLLLLPVCFHPAALWAARCVRQTREMACDAEAAERMGSPANYAWALLQVAERTSTGERNAAPAGVFSNGLFGAGLQLFTNRGAMEERMQMLMNRNGSKVRGRALRVAAGASMAALSIIAAAMLQVQPTLAAERIQQQATAATQQAAVAPQAAGPRSDRESEPALIGGEHAREQLRRANRQLMQAEAQATSADDRRKIEGAQQAIALADQALIAADTHSSARVHVDLSSLDQLSVQLKDLKLPDEAALRLQMDKQLKVMENLQAQMNTPEWKTQMQRVQTQSMQAAQAQMNSPEFKAQMEQARALDRTKIDAMLAEARKQQERAMEQIRSGAIQRQMGQAMLMARVEPAPIPSPAASPSPAIALEVQPRKPLQIQPGAIKILTKVDPIYPADARTAGTQGAVLLHVLIDEKGRVEALQVEKEDPPNTSLAKAALAAVQQWIFQPYLLNGDAIPVETTVTVNFTLMR